MSDKTKNITVALGFSFFFTTVSVVGIQLVLASQTSKTQPAKQDNVQVIYPDDAKCVSTTIAQPEESTPIEFADEKDTSEDQQKRKQHLSELQQDRLRMIEEQAAKKRQQVEESYLQRCRELQIRTETKIRSLGPQEKIAWAELKQDLEHKITNTRESTLAVGNTTPDTHAIGYSISERVSKTNVVNDPAQEFALEGQRITGQENKTLASYKRERAHLQRWRQYQLGEVEKWEELRKTDVSTAVPAIIAKPKPEVFGRVKGIMYSEDKRSIILGNSRIVHEGDTIRGVAIAEIRKDRVEFIKNEKRWTQKVGETPGPEWHQ